MNTPSRGSDLSATVAGSGRILTVVIASLCDDARGELLKRACESVRVMAGEYDYSIIVVANGDRVSVKVLSWLASRSDVRVIRLRTGSHPLARRVGAEMADGEFLAFLDDDDEFIPDTLIKKVSHFRQHPEVDVLVTDGLRVNGAKQTRIFPPPEARSADLVETMMRTGWGACALTLRTRSVDLSAFDPEFRHLEWTLITLDLASRYKFGFLEEATYRYYEDTPNSLSKRAEHNFAAPEVWRRLSRSYAGTKYEEMVRRRYGRECHNAAWKFARQGKMHEAWRLHIESLKTPGGFAMLAISAKLVLASMRGWIGVGNHRAGGNEGPDRREKQERANQERPSGRPVL
jgi:glycosyltransferase involved in cell wall biosynthesis